MRLEYGVSKIDRLFDRITAASSSRQVEKEKLDANTSPKNGNASLKHAEHGAVAVFRRPHNLLDDDNNYDGSAL